MPHVHNPVKDWITRNRDIIFPVLAFAIPLAVRTIPEILMGPYILGFDTLGFYVPNTLLWLHNGINLWSFLVVAPLFYTIFMSIVAARRVTGFCAQDNFAVASRFLRAINICICQERLGLVAS